MICQPCLVFFPSSLQLWQKQEGNNWHVQKSEAVPLCLRCLTALFPHRVIGCRPRRTAVGARQSQAGSQRKRHVCVTVWAAAVISLVWSCDFAVYAASVCRCRWPILVLSRGTNLFTHRRSGEKWVFEFVFALKTIAWCNSITVYSLWILSTCC